MLTFKNLRSGAFPAASRLALVGLVLGLTSSLSAQLTRQIGNELTAPSATSSTPLYRSASTSSFDYSIQQTLYPAATLNIPPGSTINTIRYFKTTNASSSAADNTLQVWLNNTATTDYTTSETFGNATTGATQVFSSTTFMMPATIGWIEFGPFTTPFTYTGGNLEIVVNWDCSTSATPTTGGFPWSYESYAGGLGRGYSASSAPTTASTLNLTTNQGHLRYPVIQIDYTLPAGDGVVLANNTAPVDLNPGSQTDLVMLDMTASSFNTSQTLNSITITKTGTVPDANIGLIKLIHDVNTDGQFDMGDTVLGQGTLGSGAITFNSGTGWPIPVPTTGGPSLLVTVSSTSNWGLSETIELAVAASTDVTWSGTPTDYTTYPVSSGVRTVIPPQISLGQPGTGNNYPFNFTTAGRFQTAYAATELAMMPAGSLITEIRVHGSSVTPPTYTNFKLRLAHSQTDPAIMSTTWNNFVGSQILVIDSASYIPTALAGAGAPALWSFPLTTPFIYNGTDGLLVDWSFEGKTGTGWTITTGSGRQRVYHTTDANAPAPTTNTSGGDYGIDIMYNPNPGNGHLLSGGPGATGLISYTYSNEVMLDLQAVTIGTSQDISSITVSKTGTMADAAISSVKLVLDMNDNGTVEGTDPILSAGPFTSGQVTLGIAPPITVTTTGAVRLLVAFDSVGTLAVGDTLGFEIASSSAVVWSSGNDFSAYPISNGPITVTVPLLTIGVPGTGNSFPFNYTTEGRYQTAYAASELTAIPAGSLITEIRVHGSSVTPPVYQNFQLRLAHSQTDPNVMSLTWDNFIGAQTLVIDSPSYTPTALPGQGAPALWTFPLTNPWVYNGTDGILVDWSYTGRTGGGWSVATATGRNRVYHSTSAASPTPAGNTTSGNWGIDFLFDPSYDGTAVTNGAAGTGVGPTATDLVLLDLVAYSGTNARTLSAMTLTKSGTVPDASISNVKLVQDANDNGVVDVTDTVIGSGILTSGAISFSISPALNITPAAPARLLVAVSYTGPLAFGETLELAIAQPSHITWSSGPDFTTFPVSSGVRTVRMVGTVTISQTTAADYTDIGDAFDDLETFGVGGPVVLEIQDSSTYVSTPAYTLGMDDTQPVPLLTPVLGSSATNTITLRPAAGQTPVIQGNANGAILFGNTPTSPLTGRGGLVINQNFVTVEGLEVTGGPNFGIMVQGNNSYAVNYTDITIRGCKVHDIPDGPGIAHMGQNSGYADNILIENNFVWNCLTNSVPSTSLLLINTYGSITIRNAASGSGSVRHNTIVHTSPFTNTGGIYAYSSSSTFPLNDVNNNIVICTDPLVPAIFLSSTASLPTITNCDFNCWFAGTISNQTSVNTFALWQGTGRDTNGIDTDPELSDAFGPNFNLHLTSTSPCVDPTGQTSTLATDIDGDARTTPDMGADEFVPGIDITQGTAAVGHLGQFDMGVLPAPPTATPLTFTVSNSDIVNHTLTGTPAVAITLGANLAATTVVQTQPSTTTITPTTTTTFTILVDPSGPGAFDLTVSIANTTPGRNPYIFRIVGTVNTPPAIAVSTTAGAVAPNGTINVPFNSDVSAIGLDFQVTDPETQTTFVSAVITNVTTQGFAVSTEWESAPTAVPYSLTPTTGSFTVPSITHQVTLTANDGNLSTNFVFNIAVGANTAPTITVTSNSTPVAPSGTLNVPYADPLTALGLQFTVDDVDFNDTTLSVSFTPAAPPSFNLTGEWESGPVTAPYNVTPTTGDFSVSGESYQITLTANDGLLSTPFVFNIDVGTANPPTMKIPTSGSAFTGSSTTGYSTTIQPGPVPSDLVLQLDDIEGDDIDIINVTAVPSAPAGILAPAVSTGNVNGTIVSFGDALPLDAGSAVPGTYTWTFVLDDGLAPATNSVNVSITVVDVAPTHTNGANASGGTGTPADPYRTNVALGVSPVVELALVSDANIAVALTQGGVVNDPGNASTLFNAVFNPSGSTGTITVSSSSITTVADVGTHTFFVTVTDGTNNVDVAVQVTVENTGNVEPIGSPGTGFQGTMATGFTASVDPNSALSGTTLTISDMDGDNIEVFSVAVAPADLAGITSPGTAAPQAGPFDIDWTGTANATGVPGDYVYTVELRDGITTPVVFTVTITLNDVAPTHGPGANVDATNDGSTANPYSALTETGKGGPLAMATVSDANLGQTITIASVVPAPGNPSGGAGFTISLTSGIVHAAPNKALTSNDVGEHFFTVTITDGTNSVPMELFVKVVSAGDSSSPDSSSCSTTSSAPWTGLWILLAVLALPAISRLRRARQ